MHKINLNLSVLIAGVVFSSAALAVDEPAAPQVAAPVAAVEAGSATPAAPVAADAAAAPAVVAEAPKAEEKPAALTEAEGVALMKKSGCIVCHSIQKKVVGPAYKDVAAKYRGQDGIEDKLFAKVTKGGKGVWGQVEMPAQKAKPDDIKSVIRFVLSLK